LKYRRSFSDVIVDTPFTTTKYQLSRFAYNFKLQTWTTAVFSYAEMFFSIINPMLTLTLIKVHYLSEINMPFITGDNRRQAFSDNHYFDLLFLRRSCPTLFLIREQTELETYNYKREKAKLRFSKCPYLLN
jgi:hypothetical protein